MKLKTWHFEASKDIMTKFKPQALHIIKIKYWKANGNGNPPSFIPVLRKIAILGLKPGLWQWYIGISVPALQLKPLPIDNTYSIFRSKGTPDRRVDMRYKQIIINTRATKNIYFIFLLHRIITCLLQWNEIWMHLVCCTQSCRYIPSTYYIHKVIYPKYSKHWP